MTSLLKNILTVVVTAFVACPAQTSHAQATAESFDADNATIDEQITQVPVPDKALQPLIRHIDKIEAVYKRHGLETRKERRGDVLTVIIPADALFGVNETMLSAGAPRVLEAFRDLIKQPRLYRILVVVYSDDTGSDDFANTFTETRANAIDDYYADHYGDIDLNIIPYGVGKDDPLVPNTSIVNRSCNRRVEFTIIPEKQLVEQARANKL